ncbi:MAG TPA: ABC transporter substrate-binding protein [Anaerovoracaceae bacterium]|nr:ABC transporter substrate-binding protein [Anaerovoracaceae bacterium]
MRRYMKVLCIATALIMALSLAGCGSQGETSGQASGTETESADGGKMILKVGRPEDVAYWDPLDNFNLVNWSVQRLLYDQLILRDPDGAYSPRLATEWENSEDGLSWSFTLRDDVSFTNGEKLDANDVKFTVERFLTEKLRQAANWTYLKGVDVTDPTHLTINFTQANGAFLSIISELSILDKETWEKLGKDEYLKTPVGSGPYKFVSWTQGSLIVFEKNPDYWGEPGVADVIEYHTIIDDTTRVSAFLAGDIDWIDNVPADQLATIQGNPDVEVNRVNTWDAIYLGLKCDKAPFDDPNVREAISIAIDRQAIVDSILQGGNAASWPVGGGVLGFNPASAVPKQDIETAKALIAASEYNGRKISLVAPSTWYARTSEVLQYISSCLTEIGFDVSIEMIDGATFTDRRAGGQYDIYYTGCAHVGGDPILYLNQRIVSDTMKSGYVNKDLNDKILKVITQTDLVERDKQLEEIFQIITDENAPHLFVYGIENVVVKNKKIQGDVVYKDKIIDFSHAYIAQ